MASSRKPSPSAAGPRSRKSIAYARVSSKEQEKEGFSIPAQLKLLRDYAAAQGLTVAQEYIDVETAKQTGRASDQDGPRIDKNTRGRQVYTCDLIQQHVWIDVRSGSDYTGHVWQERRRREVAEHMSFAGRVDRGVPRVRSSDPNCGSRAAEAREFQRNLALAF